MIPIAKPGMSFTSIDASTMRLTQPSMFSSSAGVTRRAAPPGCGKAATIVERGAGPARSIDWQPARATARSSNAAPQAVRPIIMLPPSPVVQPYQLRHSASQYPGHTYLSSHSSTVLLQRSQLWLDSAAASRSSQTDQQDCGKMHKLCVVSVVCFLHEKCNLLVNCRRKKCSAHEWHSSVRIACGMINLSSVPVCTSASSM